MDDLRMPNLPFENVEDVLSWLPARTLVQYKRVAKPWLSLISKPKFVKKHCDNAKKRRESARLFFISESFDCYTLDLASMGSDPKKLNFRDMQDPFLFKMVLRSCDGLILLADMKHSLFMANPTTKEFVKLLQSPFFIDPESAYIKYGFGYDQSIDEYKVVRISIPNPYSTAIEDVVTVYSLRANMWREIESPLERIALYSHSQGVFVNRTLNWFGMGCGIISFDLASESFSKMSFPSPDGEDIQLDLLDVIGECLCGIDKGCHGLGYFDVWVMKEYGVESSWVKFIVNLYPYPLDRIITSRSGKVLMYTGNVVVSYDPDEGEFAVQAVHGVLETPDAIVAYEESLVKLPEQDE